ncbi:MAG TPA: PDZ domain-containing protein [Gemmatimonadales bacterium]|nr:PDZ domain-containing protein [Gemmatimonadales bacterium]
MITALVLLWNTTAYAQQPVIEYVLRAGPGDSTGYAVEMQISDAPDTFRLAMMHHPEYDDRYWRYVKDLTVESPRGGATIARLDSALWRVTAPSGTANVRYRIEPAAWPQATRPSWRAFITPTGGLVGGPHSFMYIVGGESLPARVRLELPSEWDVATGLAPTADPRVFSASSASMLLDSPILVGRLRQWRFAIGGVPHRVVYWPLPSAVPFDTSAFVDGIERVAREAITLFGGSPYQDFTFLMVDGAYGGLEHGNSVTIGAPSTELARDPIAELPETVHEYFHTWNEVRIRPVGWWPLDYRPIPPTTGAWWYEGITMYYTDLLIRRAGLRPEDSTRTAHLESRISAYLANSGNWLLSPEQASLLANATSMMEYGDDNPSVHVQGELIGTMLDLIIRDATGGSRSLDDVMRGMMARFGSGTGYTGAGIEEVVDSVCGCRTQEFFDRYVRSAHMLDFNHYLALGGLRIRIDSVPDSTPDGAPRPDLRIFGWLPDGAPHPLLRVTDRTSAWARAGLHTGDTVLAINGSAIDSVQELRAAVLRLRVGDTVRIVVAGGSAARRLGGSAGGRREVKFVLPHLIRPRVTLQDAQGGEGGRDGQVRISSPFMVEQQGLAARRPH